jgi:hypothetical protein
MTTFHRPPQQPLFGTTPYLTLSITMLLSSPPLKHEQPCFTPISPLATSTTTVQRNPLSNAINDHIPPATSTTTVWCNPLSNAINNHIPPEVPPKPAPSFARMPKFSLHPHPKPFKTRQVPCNIKGLLGRLPQPMVAIYVFLSSLRFLTCPSQCDPDVLPSVHISRTPHMPSISLISLFFHLDILATSFVCPTKILAFNDALPEISRLNTTVLGMPSSQLQLQMDYSAAHVAAILTHSEYSHHVWAQQATLAGSDLTCAFHCSRTATCAWCASTGV